MALFHKFILQFPPRAWFDELRKQRMEELRRALELSEDSIGLVIFLSAQTV